MTETSLLGPWIRRFLMEHLVGERNLARNTQRSYRDTLRLLLSFSSRSLRKPIDKLNVEDLSADHVREFLQDLEHGRGCSVATRNQRLAAIHSLAHFIGLHSPEHVSWCGELRAILFKRAPKKLMTYLEKGEMDALLEAPDMRTVMGRRDHAILLFLYNTGARADEVAHVRITDLDFGLTPERDVSSVLIHGKGNKLRRCPLWTKTVNELIPLLNSRPELDNAFLNRSGNPLTRFGIHAVVEKYAAQVTTQYPSLGKKRVGPHTIRHTTATHLLRSGVDINTIRAWLGHVFITTTSIYAEVDLEMKMKALQNCEIKQEEPAKPWREDQGLMEFLKSL